MININEYKVCTNCNAVIESQSRFCPNCGGYYFNYYNPEAYTYYMQYANQISYAQALQYFTASQQPVKKKNNIWKIIVAAIAVFLVAIATCFVIKSTSEEDLGTYTLMVYMVGSNLESQGGSASLDIMEMIESQVDTSHVNVLLYTGGSEYWYCSIPSDCNSMYLLESNESELSFNWAGSTSYTENMGDPETFADFLNYGYENYPADHYAVICWDHGSGPLGGFGNDELYDYDSLLLTEITEALEASPFNEDNKLDWIGYDACLMSSIEVAGIWNDYAKYMIASQETEAADGWDYSFLSVLNETSDPEKIAERIIDSYAAYYEENSSQYYSPEVTLSCMDLSQLSNTVESMDNLFNKMEESLDEGAYSKLVKSREAVKCFGLSATGGKGNSLDLVDLGNCAELLEEMFPSESKALLKAIDKLVVYQTSNVYSTSGVSLYYPYDNAYNFEYLGQYLYEDISESEGYKSYVKSFSEKWLGQASSYNWRFSAKDTSEDVYEFYLSNEQMENLSSIEYNIFMESSVGGYTPVLSDCKVEADKNGKVEVDLDKSVIYAQTDDSNLIWTMRQLESNEEYSVYQTTNTRVLSGDGFGYYHLSGGFEDVSIKMSDRNGELKMLELTADSEDISMLGKNTLNINNWDVFYYYCKSYIPTYENEMIKPFDEWEEDTWGLMSTIGIDDSIEFVWMKASQLVDTTLYCQLVFTDVNGNTYGSDLFELADNDSYKVYEEKTEKGVIKYNIYDDYAELSSYEGSDEILNIPESVNGVKLTTIAAYAFSFQSNPQETLKEIVIPDSVETIGQGAFSWCEVLEKVTLPEGLREISSGLFSDCGNLKEVNIPESVKCIKRYAFTQTALTDIVLPAGIEIIESGAFAGCYNVTVFEFDGENENYKIEDGVLFTADGKKLIASPGTGKEEYIIPEGVEEICDYAFSGAYSESIIKEYGYGLTKISFPDSLKVIGDYAFYGCTMLESLLFPENLERIGHAAFASALLLEGNSFLAVELGPKLSWIGKDAFSGYSIDQFVYSDTDKNVISSDDQLLNKLKVE